MVASVLIASPEKATVQPVDPGSSPKAVIKTEAPDGTVSQGEAAQQDGAGVLDLTSTKDKTGSKSGRAKPFTVTKHIDMFRKEIAKDNEERDQKQGYLFEKQSKEMDELKKILTEFTRMKRPIGQCSDTFETAPSDGAIDSSKRVKTALADTVEKYDAAVRKDTAACIDKTAEEVRQLSIMASMVANTDQATVNMQPLFGEEFRDPVSGFVYMNQKIYERNRRNCLSAFDCSEGSFAGIVLGAPETYPLYGRVREEPEFGDVARFNVRPQQKDEAKDMGARFDWASKEWYVDATDKASVMMMTAFFGPRITKMPKKTWTRDSMGDRECRYPLCFENCRENDRLTATPRIGVAAMFRGPNSTSVSSGSSPAASSGVGSSPCSSSSAASASASSSSSSHFAARMQQILDWKTAGVLTEEEFVDQKQKILASMMN